MARYIVFTDGAYSSSRDRGGSAFVILEADTQTKVYEWSHTWNGGTNNTAEILAILMAIRTFKKPIDSVIIYSDSTYCLGCAFGTYQRKKNKKLWSLFDREHEKLKQLCPDIQGIHVDGHQKDKKSFEARWNNYVDKLAVQASHETPEGL